MMMNFYKVSFGIVFSAVFLLGIFFSPFSVFGAEKGGIKGEKSIISVIGKKNRGPVVYEEGGKIPAAQNKRAMSILVSGVRYRIISTTQIIDTAGLAITMDSLPVPCEARIYYKPIKRGESNVLRIELKKVLSGASKRWPSGAPE